MTARRREDTGLFALVTDRLAVTGVLVAVAVVPILLPVPGLALSLLNYIVLTLGFLLALGALGLDLTKLTILAGAFGVGLGFGLQSVVNNFVSGLLLLFERPIHVGDVIEIDDLLGEVTRIGIWASTVRTVRGAEMIVPNAQLVAERVTNWTLSDRRRRIEIAVSVAYASPPEKVVAVLQGGNAVYAALQGAGMTIPLPSARGAARALVGRWARPRRGEGRNGGRGHAAGGDGRKGERSMRCRARSVMLVTAVVACLVSGAAAAQDKAADTMELLREKVRADKKLVVATALELTESEAKAFGPVYNTYQRDMIVHYDRVLKLFTDYAAAYESMTDAAATQLLGEFVALEADHVALLSKYVPRFQGALPPRKVARFYQVENKLRALLNYDLARSIPLLK